ncbi:MAG: PilZ domain-containing protein [Defluviitaleaceae bacterium]|nr:PilZ domain-containing protein [Defluviitaleaceae bacterium]MCL2275849.1 PilZ domain-containing protein [Defluviitaleaceae bacterium]
MKLKDLKSGTLVLISHNDEANAKVYKTRLEVVEGEQTILMEAPMERRNLVRFVPRDIYKLSFQIDTIHVNFEGKYMETVKIDGIHMLRFFVLSTGGERVQRRKAYRFICSLPVSFNVVADNGEQSPRTDGIVRDLSSGGIRMATTIKIPDNALLRIDLFLDDDYVMAFGIVRSRRHTPENVKTPYNYGISFEAMPETEAERIVKFVYNEQRKLLKRPQQSLYKSGK